LETRFTKPSDTRDHNWWTIARKQLNSPALFDCMVQQNPSRSDLGMFPEDKWVMLPRSQWPSLYVKCRAWDLAATEGGGDYTVGTLMGLDHEQNLYICERERAQISSNTAIERVKEMTVKDGKHIPVVIEQQKSGAGANIVEFYARELKGCSVHGSKTEGTKEQRATPYSHKQKAGQVILPSDEEDAEWVNLWVKEHALMMGDGRKPAHDDCIDTGAHGTNFLLEHGLVEILDPEDFGNDLERMLEMEKLLDSMGYN
jgi:predicted phage terminase large subunit-like protein